MPDRNHKNITAPRLLFLLALLVFSLLGACNSQVGEGVREITDEAERTETTENSDADTQEKEQEAAPLAELTDQPPVEERFASFEPAGEVSQKLLAGLEEAEGNFRDALSTAIKEADISATEASVLIIEREDEAGNVWHNAIIGIPASTDSGYLDRLWLYAEVNEAETQYVLPGEGIEGRLIPMGVSYVVGEEKVGLRQLGEGQKPEAVLFRLGYGEGENFQGVREFIYFDLQEGEIYCTDPWTGERYQLENALDRALVASMMPIESQLFPGLPAEKAREALNQGWLPDLDEEDGWVAKDNEGAVVKEWSEESREWVDALGEWERGFKEQWAHDIEAVNKNISEFLSMPDEQLAAYIRKYQMKHPQGSGGMREVWRGDDGFAKTRWYSRSGDVLGV